MGEDSRGGRPPSDDARTGRFSSDRSTYEYCRDIWRVEPVPLGEIGEKEIDR